MHFRSDSGCVSTWFLVPKSVRKASQKPLKFKWNLNDFLNTFQMAQEGPIPSFLQYLPCEIKVFGVRPGRLFNEFWNHVGSLNGPESFLKPSKNQLIFSLIFLAKMVPKWHQKTFPKSFKKPWKITPEIYPKIIEKYLPKWSQNDLQNGTKNI